MYNNTSYEEYMRSALGYMPNSDCGMQDTYQTNECYTISNNQNSCNFENLYPDIYRTIYPLICNECRANSMPVTEEVVEKMTENIYRNIEIDLKIETNSKLEMRNGDVKNPNEKQIENRESRQRNNWLRDLIKILILRELLGGGIGRPPFPGPGGRPPFPGPGGRPPFPGPMPRDY